MNEIRFEQIENYLNGELTGIALTDFETQLKADPVLREEVELHRDIDIALMDDNEIPFIQTMRDIHEKQTETPVEEVDSKQLPRRRILRFAIAAAAAVLLAVFALPFLFPKPDAMQLSENTIGDAPTLEIQRSADGRMETTKSLIAPYQKIENGQYAEAIPELSKIYTATNDDEAALGLGYCHLQVKNYDNAIQIFKKIQTENGIESDTAAWYLAHSYLRKGNIQESKHILQKIISNNNVTLKRREQAKSLLDNLEKIN